jgi:alanyl-tRNA synthetase
VRPSDTLVPSGDPTLLFTTAGMVQFKKLGAGAPLEFSRAATVQKCLRARAARAATLRSGQDHPAPHVFSKCWEISPSATISRPRPCTGPGNFITTVLKMPTDRLYVSVYKNDDEAFGIWNREIGIPADRIVRLGDKDNFWGPAETPAPAGRARRFITTSGPNAAAVAPTASPAATANGIWSSGTSSSAVFPEQGRIARAAGAARHRHGDGAGAAVPAHAGRGKQLPDRPVRPDHKRIADMCGAEYKGANVQAMNVIADHVRALTFTFGENILPGNEGRGYVLRRILRRACASAASFRSTSRSCTSWCRR